MSDDKNDPPKWGQSGGDKKPSDRRSHGKQHRRDEERSGGQNPEGTPGAGRSADETLRKINRPLYSPFNRFLDIYAGGYLLLCICVLGSGFISALKKGASIQPELGLFVIIGLMLLIPGSYLWHRWRVGWQVDEVHFISTVSGGGILAAIFGILFMLFSGGCILIMAAFGGMASEKFGMFLVGCTIGGPLFIWGHYLVWRGA